MKRTMLAAFAIAMLATTTGNLGVAVANDNDGRIEDKIEARFSHDSKLKTHDLDVDVDKGVATLKGKVASEAERLRAEKLARVAGVNRIDNKLEIDTGAVKDRIEDDAKLAKKRIDDRAERAKDRIDEQEDRAKDRVDARADKVKNRPAEPVVRRDTDRVGDGENEVSDAWITTKVKTQFIGVDALKGSDISVETNNNGSVTLTGTIPNELARARAIEITRTTKGVKKINDNLRLAPPM
jgi:osmotically-inducible protein OsmY